MKIGDGPAAVTGDESCIKSLWYSVINRNVVGRRMKRLIRKSEDLPGKSVCLLSDLEIVFLFFCNKIISKSLSRLLGSKNILSHCRRGLSVMSA